MLRNEKDQYLHLLPYSDRINLCKILDQDNKWEELGTEQMKYDSWTVQSLRIDNHPGYSPSNALLTMWEHQNHTVHELFVLLTRMKHYRAMQAIKNHVDEKYHKFIRNVEVMVQDLSITDNDSMNRNLDRGIAKKVDTEKIINCEPVLKSSPPIAVPQRENVALFSDENNESAPAQPHVPMGRSPLLDIKTATDISTVAGSVGGIPQIPYDELQQATNNWNTSSILGKGGFGTVFIGKWKCTTVAIKRIEKRENQPDGYKEEIRQSFTELHWLYAYRHDNVLPLYGYSLAGPQPCLVYQYMPGGCLDRRLRVRDTNKVLSWITRLNIAIGTARGLQFLHTIGQKPLIHGDIKTANILLDASDNPRIGDFGLAREGPQTEYTHISRIQGTKPYLPPEFLRGRKFSTKVDTYSFGIVLFEIGTSLSAYSERRDKENKYLKDYIVNYQENLLELKDKRAPAGESTYLGLMEIGKLCISDFSKDRPEMVSVLIQLEGVPKPNVS